MLLARSDVDANKADKTGMTPLQVARNNSRYPAVSMLEDRDDADFRMAMDKVFLDLTFTYPPWVRSGRVDVHLPELPDITRCL